MIEFTHHGIKVKCKPEIAAEYRRLMDKPPKAKTISEKRDYPKWNPTMTTSDYLRAYIQLNERRKMIPCDHVLTCSAFKVPTMYDSAAPEI